MKLPDQVFQLLVNAYTQADRYYHNLTHIHHVLATVERFSSILENPTAVFLAVWFHDFVYDSQASDNEFQSAKAAEELLTSIGLERELIYRVRDLIIATAGHQIDIEDRDKCIFLDADLAILGADPVTYQVYARSIRLEYSWLPDLAYRDGRIRVLENFLNRDRLYCTKMLFDELESIARSNINDELALLR